MKDTKGITLILLIVIVIMLLILTGVFVGTLSGNNGTIRNAENTIEQAKTGINQGEQTINEIIAGTLGDAEVDNSLPDGVYNANKIIEEDNVNDYIGKYVTNYKPAGVTDVKWRIFYIGKDPTDTGENNIYLIADHYVPRNELPAKNGKTPNVGSDSSGNRTAYFTDVYSEYAGSSSIENSNPAYNWLNQWNVYLSNNSTSSTYENIRSVAYMMDTEIWNKFGIVNISKYAIGGPTLELFAKSYNTVHLNQTIDTKVDGISGYKTKMSSESESGYDSSSLYIEDDTDLWKPYSQYKINTERGYEEKEAQATWIASPFYYETRDNTELFYVNYNGNVYHHLYRSLSDGFRPIVCLKANTRLTTDDNGQTYKILGLNSTTTTPTPIPVARIGSTTYPSVQSAVDSIHDSTKTTIELLCDTNEQVNISGNKDIVLNLNDFTITSTGTTISNNDSSTIEIVGGNLVAGVKNSEEDEAAVSNNQGGTIILNNITITTNEVFGVYIPDTCNNGTVTLKNTISITSNDCNPVVNLSTTSAVNSTSTSDITLISDPQNNYAFYSLNDIYIIGINFVTQGSVGAINSNLTIQVTDQLYIDGRVESGGNMSVGGNSTVITFR